MTSPGIHPSPHWDCPSELAGIQIIEDAHIVEVGPLETVERTWRERLYDWPWTPWQATKQERYFVPSSLVFYDGERFYCHPRVAHGLRSQLRFRWPANEKTRPWTAQPRRP